MMITLLKKFLRKFRNVEIDPVAAFLNGARGVIHIGANKGQERYLYEKLGLNVLWIEPIPNICQRLRKNVSSFRKQIVLEALLLDRDDVDVVLHVANNGGASSSIMDFRLHSEVWPDVKFTHDVTCRSKTLSRLLRDHEVDVAKYDALVLDTQGSELMILHGASDLLSKFRIIQVEAADFEAYEGGATVSQIEHFLSEFGFVLRFKSPFAERDGGGTYFDLVFESVPHA
jgi:FkbM family methyltransferase